KTDRVPGRLRRTSDRSIARLGNLGANSQWIRLALHAEPFVFVKLSGRKRPALAILWRIAGPFGPCAVFLGIPDREYRCSAIFNEAPEQGDLIHSQRWSGLRFQNGGIAFVTRDHTVKLLQLIQFLDGHTQLLYFEYPQIGKVSALFFSLAVVTGEAIV